IRIARRTKLVVVGCPCQIDVAQRLKVQRPGLAFGKLFKALVEDRLRRSLGIAGWQCLKSLLQRFHICPFTHETIGSKDRPYPRILTVSELLDEHYRSKQVELKVGACRDIYQRSGDNKRLERSSRSFYFYYFAHRIVSAKITAGCRLSNNDAV